MSCSYYNNTYYCGAQRCKTINSNSDLDARLIKGNVKSCPSGYNSSWQYYGAAVKKKCSRQIKGDKLDCALNKYDAKYCPNGYCGADARESIEYMKKYCSGANIVSKAGCKEWKDVNETEYTKKLGEFCNNISSLENYAECRNYCVNKPGGCSVINSSSGGYCSLHKDDPICGCVNSPLNDLPPGKKGVPPATCFDNVCINSGYKPSTTARGLPGQDACGDFMDCSQNINVSDGGLMERVRLSQVCLIQKKEELAKKKEGEAAAAAANAERNRNSELAQILADEKAREAVWAAKQERIAREKYIRETPMWKQQYDGVVSSGAGKQIADAINNIIPTIDGKVAGVELNEIKPLIVLFFLLIILISIRSRGNGKTVQPLAPRAHVQNPYPQYVPY